MSKASNAPSAEPTTTEEWRAIPGWPYEASSRGRIRHTIGTPPLKPWLCTGYEYVTLCDGGKRRTARVATVVAAAFLGPRPRGLQINHKNARKTDNRPENLEYVTCSENNRHAFRLGLNSAKGERNSNSVLTEMGVRVMRRAHKRVPRRVLAEMFGVSHRTVGHVQRGDGWSHIVHPIAARKEAPK